MSFITLKSSLDPDSITAPALFNNNFRDGITFNPNDTITLVSLTVTKNGVYNVDSNNDTIVWRIGGRTTGYEQHVAVIQHGPYTVDRLCTAIETAMNNSTVIGVYMPLAPGDKTFGWQCEASYDTTTAAITLKITNVQQTLPTLDAGTVGTNFDVQTYLIEGSVAADLETSPINAKKEIDIVGSSFGPDLVGDLAPQINTASPGIFANGGSVTLDVFAVTGIENISNFENLIQEPLEDAENTMATPDGNTDWFVGSKNVKIVAYTGGGSWDLTLTGLPSDDGTGTLIPYYMKFISIADSIKSNGFFVMGTTDAADPDDNASWDAPKPIWFYHPDSRITDPYGDQVEGRIISVPFLTDGAGNPVIPNVTDDILNSDVRENAFVLERSDGAPYDAESTAHLQYPRAQLGFARSQLRYYDTDDGDNDERRILSGDGETDLWIRCSPDFDNATVQGLPIISVTRMVTSTTTAFPEPGWRTSADVVPPTSIQDLTGLETFSAGDVLRMSITIDALRQVTCFLSYSTDGTTFTDPAIIASTKTTPSPPQQWNTTIQESHFPLSACYALSVGSTYQPLDYTTFGTFDRQDSRPFVPHALGANDIDESALNADSNAVITSGEPLTLSSLFKFAFIPDGTPGFNVNDIVPNVANAGNLLGMPETGFIVNAAGNAVPTAQGSRELVKEPFEQSLHVELTDFNISGRNGQTESSTKTVAVVSKQKLLEGEDTDIAHYEAPFPIPINLNLNHEKTLYSMNVALRRTDGTIATDLAGSTEITLLHDEASESKQARLLARQIAKIGERQGQQFATVGDEFPRV